MRYAIQNSEAHDPANGQRSGHTGNAGSAWMRNTVLATASALLFASGSALASSKDIVDTAVSAGQFSTLVKAVQQAGLVDTLRGEGPFTVFAPTDEAFARLPAGTLESLLANPDQLRAVLTYHVVPGRIMSSDVSPGELQSAQGDTLRIALQGDAVMVDDAKVIATDVAASNGVIHVIDTVVIPDTAAGNPPPQQTSRLMY